MKAIDLTSAQEFLSTVRPSSSLWSDSPVLRDGWLFRGQGDANWPLRASAFRLPYRGLREKAYLLHRSACEFICKEAGIEPEARIDVSRKIEAAAVVMTELDLVHRFASLADDLGLIDALPGTLLDMDEVRAFLLGTKARLPTPGMVTSIAQHHGIPTRLLDFSRSPLVAAFFAAESANWSLLSGMQIDRFALWAVNKLGVPGSSPVDSRVREIRYPSGGNRYSREQSGAFLLDVEAEAEFVRTGSWSAIDALMGEGVVWGRPSVIRVTLPASEALPLMELLGQERISRARLMPTLDHVALEVFPRWIDELPEA